MYRGQFIYRVPGIKADFFAESEDQVLSHL